MLFFVKKKIAGFSVLTLLASQIVLGIPLPEDPEKEIGPLIDGLKFGVLVENEHYQIYRSKKLGDGGLEELFEDYFQEKGQDFPKTIIYMNRAGYKFPFYYAIDEHKLQDKYGYQFYHSFGTPRTYLDGFNPYDADTDIDEKKPLGRHARKYFSYFDDGIDGDVDDFFTIMELVLNPYNQPVLFHCFGGRHRTGMVALAIRYMQGGRWTNGPRFHRKDMWMNAAQFEYYRFNHAFFREENLEFIDRVIEDERFIQLKEKYGPYLRDSFSSISIVKE